MKLKSLFVFLATSSLISSVSAMESMKPGLWEHSFTIKSQSGQVEKGLADMKKSMAKMPPEQRKMMEEMMAKQGMGVSDKGTSVKVCISKEQAEKLDIPQSQDSNCKQEILSRTSKNIKIKFTCTGNPSSTGEGEFTLINPGAYVGKAVVNTDSNGKKDRLDMDQKGKWLAADCGAIQPIKTQK